MANFVRNRNEIGDVWMVSGTSVERRGVVGEMGDQKPGTTFSLPSLEFLMPIYGVRRRQ